MNVVYAPRALRDLQGIAEYLNRRSPSGAFNVLAAVKSSIEAPPVNVLPWYLRAVRALAGQNGFAAWPCHLLEYAVRFKPFVAFIKSLFMQVACSLFVHFVIGHKNTSTASAVGRVE